MDAPPHSVQSDITVFSIVEALDRRGEMGVTEIAEETGITKSSVYKHLDTLRYLGYIRKEGAGYSLSLRWFETGRRVRERERAFQAARPELTRLAKQTGETISLVVEEGGDAVYVFQTSEEELTRGPVEEGGRLPATLSTGGKAILSYRPVNEVRNLLRDENADEVVEEMILELEALREQRIVFSPDAPRESQFSAGSVEGHRHAGDRRSSYQDLNSVAVPVRNIDDYAVAAIEVSGAESTLYGRRLEEEIVSLLVSTGKAVETALLQSRR